VVLTDSSVTEVDEETYVTKYRVTMVSWSTDDEFVVTAVNDFSLKVWNSNSGQLVHVLQVSCTAFTACPLKFSYTCLTLPYGEGVLPPSAESSSECYYLHRCFRTTASGAVTVLVVHQDERPACNKISLQQTQCVTKEISGELA